MYIFYYKYSVSQFQVLVFLFLVVSYNKHYSSVGYFQINIIYIIYILIFTTYFTEKEKHFTLHVMEILIELSISQHTDGIQNLQSPSRI